MMEYHAHTSPNLGQTHSAHLMPKKFCLGKLAEHYGVADMMEFAQSDSHHAGQSVDDEFLAYITATFGSAEIGDADILAFWEVS
jgi:hypothetical protein